MAKRRQKASKKKKSKYMLRSAHVNIRYRKKKAKKTKRTIKKAS